VAIALLVPCRALPDESVAVVPEESWALIQTAGVSASTSDANVIG
jgi:hypothetical protein